MADLRIADAPELSAAEVEDGLKVPTGGFGNYAVTFLTIRDWLTNFKGLVTQEQLALKADQATTYTKTETDEALSNKANFVDVYQKNETYTKAEVDTKVGTVSGGYFKAFDTLASLQAATGMTTGQVAKVMNDPTATNNGDYRYNGTAWVKGYDSLTDAKAYADANPMFKAKKVVAGNDVNNFLDSGAYVLEGNLPDGSVLNHPLSFGGFQASGTFFVHGITIGGIKLATQIFYPYVNTWQPMIRSNSTSSGAWGAWDKITLDSTKNNLVDLTTGQDVRSLTQGRYRVATTTIGNSLLNMPSAPFKMGVITVDVVGTFKILRFTPYGKDVNFYQDASFEGITWSGWQVFSPDTSGQITAVVSNITKDDFFGKKFSAGELAGTLVYANAFYVGYNSITTKSVSFNTIKANMYNSLGGECQWRLYTGSAVNTGTFGYNVLAAQQNNYTASGTCTLPTGNSGVAQEISLGKVITLGANQPFVIIFRKTNISQIAIGYTNAVTGNLENRGFNLGTSNVDWGAANISNGSVPAFTQTGFQLLLNISSSGPTPEPVTYLPTLILPPKVYALEGLESHIYPEHTLVEDYKLYNYDVTCTKGRHMNRGWVWTPSASDVAGNYALSLTAHDKQKGDSLNTATTTVVLANKTANSGVTKKVCVIGDSLVQGGVITQRLLDIDDVMDINLIGTRGTAPNLHEGRGGWTIADYTGAGRTYYRFTVSGVTVTPAINATTYTYNGTTFMVQETALTSGSGTISCNIVTGSAPTAGSSGTLTKSNASDGDATIAFTDVQPTSGNPFWNGSSIDFQNYLTANGLQTPDVVVLQLGINDTFGFTSDAAVESFTTTAFSSLDVLINSIKAVSGTIKVAVTAPPSYADQDAFGFNYANGQTSWRAKRNITTFNKKLYAYYGNKEAQNIYVLGGGVNMDAENNFPTGVSQINSHNTNTITVQTNAVHPATGGYRQISDVIFSFIKTT